MGSLIGALTLDIGQTWGRVKMMVGSQRSSSRCTRLPSKSKNEEICLSCLITRKVLLLQDHYIPILILLSEIQNKSLRSNLNRYIFFVIIFVHEFFHSSSFYLSIYQNADLYSCKSISL